MPRTPKPRNQRKGELLAAQVEMGMKRELEGIATERDWPVAQVIREALRQYLERQKAAA